jgi:hypothetical protein
MKRLGHEIDFCYQCEDFPCDRLKTIDMRYRKKYNASLIENLCAIKESGKSGAITYHLHFDVTKDCSQSNCQTIPFKFKNFCN